MGLFDIFKKKSQNSSSGSTQEFPPNNPEMQTVCLFFENEPLLDKATILSELKARFTNVETVDDDLSDSPLVFFFPDYLVPLQEDAVPAQGAIITMDQQLQLDRFTTAFRQSWHWDNAEKIMAACKYEINLTDLMSRSLPPMARLAYFQKFVSAVVKATNPQVVYFRNSDKLLDPGDFLKTCDIAQNDFLHGALNVRLFSVANGSEKELLMDTLGLHAFGLTDFECRFTDYDPSDIAKVLQNLAYYIFETGDTIRSNTTVEGIGKNPIWKTQFANAKVEPERLVVEIIPR